MVVELGLWDTLRHLLALIFRCISKIPPTFPPTLLDEKCLKLYEFLWHYLKKFFKKKKNKLERWKSFRKFETLWTQQTLSETIILTKGVSIGSGWSDQYWTNLMKFPEPIFKETNKTQTPNSKNWSTLNLCIYLIFLDTFSYQSFSDTLIKSDISWFVIRTEGVGFEPTVPLQIR